MNYAREYLMREIEVLRNAAETYSRKIQPHDSENDSWNGRLRVLPSTDAGSPSYEIIKKIQSIYHFYHIRSVLYKRRAYFPRILRGKYTFSAYVAFRVTGGVTRRRKDAKVFSYCKIKERNAWCSECHASLSRFVSRNVKFAWCEWKNYSTRLSKYSTLLLF